MYFKQKFSNRGIITQSCCLRIFQNLEEKLSFQSTSCGKVFLTKTEDRNYVFQT